MTSITREQILAAAERGNQELYSVVEIAGLLGVPENTAKSHFSRNGFKPVSTASRGRRVYDQAGLKRYCLWLFMAREADSPMGYTALQRDEILRDADLDDLWSALEVSLESFIQKLMKIQSGAVL